MRKKQQNRPKVALPASALALARYHASLSDPFGSASSGIPDGAPPVTFQAKAYAEAIESDLSTVAIYRVKVWKTSTTDTLLQFLSSYDHGVTWVGNNTYLVNGPMRIVSAGIRYTYTGKADELGGVYVVSNHDNEQGANTLRNDTHHRFTGVAVGKWKPYRLADYEFGSGTGSGAADPESANRYLDLMVQLPAGVSVAGGILEFVVQYESERVPGTAYSYASGDYHTFEAHRTMSVGHQARNIVHKVKATNPRRTVTSREPHGHKGSRSFKTLLVNGLKDAGEIMGLGASAATAYHQLSSAMSLGAQLEAEVVTAAESLGELSPLMLAL